MRVMVMVKATKSSEAGVMPSEELLRAMGEYNEQLVKAGVMLAGEGLKPSSMGKRVRFAGGRQMVLDGPFAETKELVAGFWLWQVKSMDEALEWLRRCPDPMPGEESELEVRPVFEMEDFGAELTPELRAQEERLQAELKAGRGNQTSTIRLHRVLRAKPERVYNAFLDPAAKAKWLPPHGFTGTVHHLDARVGGTYRMSFTNQSSGQSHSFGGTYTELTPHSRIRFTDRFEDPNLPGEMHVTVELRPVSCGTELTIVQEGVPAVIPAEQCYVGWQESLVLLADLVEAEITG
jgi:uncharacterized protein YndB with AHSA1/START domain